MTNLHLQKIQNMQIYYYKKRRRKMSHLISGISVSPQPILDKAPLKNVVAPKFKHLLKQNNRRHSRHNDSWKQQIAISNLCKKLTQKQYVLLRKNNASQIEHHFAKLRWKLKKQATSKGASVSRFFDGEQQQSQLDVKHLMQRMPRKVHLVHKYNTKLVNFTESINDAKKINNQKENYARWLDNNNNSPVKSPNYCRMSFVLQKLQYQPRLISKQHHHKKMSNYALFMAPIKNEKYMPQGKRMKTLGSDIINYIN